MPSSENLFDSLPASAAISNNLFLETEYYYLEGHIFNDDVLVVVFEPAGGEDPRLNGFRPGWGTDVFRKRRCSVLSIKPKRVNWYVTPDLEAAFLEISCFFSGFRRIVTYGVSMGGFGALCYSDTIGADSAFVFSPQTTLDPAKILDGRFPRATAWDFTTCFGDVKGRFDRLKSAYVFYDINAPLDRLHVRRVRNARLIEIRVPGSGHSSIELTKQCGALTMVVDFIVSGDVDLIAFYKRLRRRKNSRIYQDEIQRQWRRRVDSHRARSTVAE
ncbi:MAG: hypothetical protein KDE63_03060 [Novosphingobium sp.]|nr:hypothetical protein [Novosphingobium sp.]